LGWSIPVSGANAGGWVVVVGGTVVVVVVGGRVIVVGGTDLTVRWEFEHPYTRPASAKTPANTATCGCALRSSLKARTFRSNPTEALDELEG